MSFKTNSQRKRVITLKSCVARCRFLLYQNFHLQVCLHERVMRWITQILFNERREDKTFKMHNINTSLKVFFNKEKVIALGKYNHNSSLLLLFYVLQSLYCTLVTQSHLPVGPFIPFSHLTSTLFFALLRKTLFYQNISFLTAGTWLDVYYIFRNKIGILSLMGLQLIFVCILSVFWKLSLH